MELIAVKDLIKKAKRRGIDFGKGDPYNRLRYYTKIGWLPHMIRRTGKTGVVEGHYPEWVLDRLEYIDSLKDGGLSNNEIEKRLRIANVRNSFGDVFSFLNIPEKRTQFIAYLSLAFLFLIFLSELGLLTGRGTKQDLLQVTQQPFNVAQTLVDSGAGLFPGGEKLIFVKSSFVTANSKVYITFMDNYSPASRFWVSKVVPVEGFYVELDSPTAQNTSFNWWVSN